MQVRRMIINSFALALVLFSTGPAGCGELQRPIDGQWKVTEVKCGGETDTVETTLHALYSEPFELVFNIDDQAVEIHSLPFPASFEFKYTDPGQLSYELMTQKATRETKTGQGTYELRDNKLTLTFSDDSLFCEQSHDKTSTLVLEQYPQGRQNLIEGTPHRSFEGLWVTHKKCERCVLEYVTIRDTGELLVGLESLTHLGNFVAAKNESFGVTLHKPLKNLKASHTIVRFLNPERTTVEFSQGERSVILHKVLPAQ